METLKFLVDLYIRGGFFMHLLLLVGVFSFVMVVERLFYLRENRLDWDRFQFELKSALKNDDLGKAIAVAARTKGVIGRVMQECLLRVQAGETDIADATDKEILTEMSSMERSRGWLSTMIRIAPLLGLIGTVVGMIQCFMVIEQSGVADPRVLANGIYTKLVTTFAGLFIAVTVSVAHEYIRKECNKILHYLDLYLLEVRDWVKAQKPQVIFEEREMSHV